MEVCKADPKCITPQSVNELKKQFEDFMERELKEGEKREHYRNVQDKIFKCVEKLDRTIHGEEDTGHKGLLEEIQEIKSSFYVVHFFDTCWKAIKKPVIVILFFAICASLLFGIPMVHTFFQKINK